MPSEIHPVPTLVHEQRRHPRVQLCLPVRLRWLTPLGQVTEATETLDVSRGGLLIYRNDACRPGARVWATFPFDSTLRLAQAETLARVVRLQTKPEGGHLVAIEFEALPRRPHAVAAGAAARAFPGGAGERRRRERIPLALPIRVRPPDSPWPEETMTINISDDGVLLCTTRLYAVDDAVCVALPPGSFAGRWASPKELPARVVRVEKDTRRNGGLWQQVALTLLPPKKP